ncbi:MAG: hypothetical protein PW786_13770 [Arachidicoccus sp.]|nr:hypothetical protein [Arachidicoccus sp.]
MLTEKQINSLYKFCSHHYVRYYDVQTELVDHLTNAIEEKMEADKNLDFETTLKNVYEAFGDNGFKKIIQQKTMAIKKEHSLSFSKTLKSFFIPPNVLLVIAIAIIYYYIYHFAYSDNLLVRLWGWTTVSLTFLYTCFNIGLRIKYRKPLKLLLSLQSENFPYIFPLTAVFPIINKFFTYNKSTETFLHNPTRYMLATICYLSILMLGFAISTVFKNAIDKSKKDYPLAFQN